MAVGLVCDGRQLHGNALQKRGEPDVDNQSVSNRYIHDLFNEGQEKGESLVNRARWGHQVKGLPWEMNKIQVIQ